MRSKTEIIRARYYSFFYKIGRNNKFGKIKFWDSDKEGIVIGDNVTILRGTEIQGKKGLPVIIHDNVFINQGCLVRANVEIGSNASIGQKVSIISDTHEIGSEEKRAGKSLFPKITIGKGCWIGANSTILSGVNIGDGTIVAAGSVVNKDCVPNSLYGGVPARKIRDLD